MSLGKITLEKGVYNISANYNYGSNPSGKRYSLINYGTANKGHELYDIRNAVGGGDRTIVTFSGVIEILNATIIDIRALQNSGMNLSITATVDILKLA